MKNYFIIHGSFGNSQSNWFPWLEKELTSRGEQVFNLDFPIGVDKQNYKNWEIVLNSVKRFINEDSVFFCHSISCIFLVKYCIENNIKIGKAFMVSGFNQYLGLNEEYDTVNCTMYTNRIKEFKEKCVERTCFYSDNDPYVPFDKLQSFVKDIEAKGILIKGAMHLNAEAGYTMFENLLQYI